jgi:hypothetical protein
MNAEIELLKETARRLDRAGIKYMMTGSMAMALYALPRMTRDIDMVVEITPADADRLLVLFQDDFYIDAASVRAAIQSTGMFNVIHNESVIKVDFIVRKNEEYRLEEFARRRAVDVDGTPVTVVAPEDLLLSKLVWAKLSQSELQFRDVRQMMGAVRNLDRPYLEKWAARLGVADLLDKPQKHE